MAQVDVLEDPRSGVGRQRAFGFQEPRNCDLDYVYRGDRLLLVVALHDVGVLVVAEPYFAVEGRAPAFVSEPEELPHVDRQCDQLSEAGDGPLHELQKDVWFRQPSHCRTV